MTEERLISQEQEFTEERASLWMITFGPLIWAVHFVVCYAATAVVCAKLPAAMPSLRWSIAVATLLALAGIVWVGWRAWQQWDYLDDYDYIHDEADSEARHEFLGHAAFLLAVVAFIGTVYTALPAWLAGTCQ